ncbi:MAG TPA: hypothetical protein VI548_11755, partial [Chitinophagaceae bacterium]|nr:hypothetical protein [Chitinophagaceae bacterium]
IGATKYQSMTPEEREKLIGELKEKAKKFKGEAEDGFEKAKEYFDEIRSKGSEALKEHFGEMGSYLQTLFGGEKEAAKAEAEAETKV